MATSPSSDGQHALISVGVCQLGIRDSFRYSMLKRFLQELPHFVELFNIVIPGSEIPEWFNNQSMGDSVIEKLPSHSCNSKWMGFALCALFEAAQLRHHKRYMECSPSFGSNNTFPDRRGGIGVSLNKVASDHLCLVFLSRKFLSRNFGLQPETNRWEKCWDQIQFRIITDGSKTCLRLKVKKCGVRTLYEQDTAEELNRTMKQYSNRSISLCDDITNCDFDESKTVQRDVIKRTREQYSNEAGPSESGSSSKDQVKEA